MQIIVVQSGLNVTAIATTIRHTYTHALKLTYVYGYCYAYIHPCAIIQLTYRGNGRRAPRHQEGGAQQPRATLNYNYNYATVVGPTRHQRRRRTRGGGRERHQRDRRAQGGIQETPEGPEGARGIQETPGGPGGNHGGIGAGREARE
jgi:hypothetical protein